MLQWFGKSKVGFSWLISTGDESATGIEELMEALVDDPTVGTIMLFLEGSGMARASGGPRWRPGWPENR